MSIKISVEASGLHFDPDKEKVDLDCPKCKAKIRATFGQIQREETLTCLNCQTAIKLKDKNHSAARAVSDINHAFDELKDALEELGR